MPNFFSDLLSSDSFMPHGHCYLWQANILWTHVISDAIIGLAYATIPFALIYLVRKRKDLAFNWIFVMFGIFILACGATHVMNIWTVWDPVYRLTAVVKAITAAASIGTAVALWPLIPRVLVLPSPSQLRKANESLHLEIVERKKAEEALEERNRALIEAEKLKSEFVANVSHELRTPLTLILAPIESLLNSPESRNLPERSLNSLATIHGNAIRLLQMVNSLLDFSKLEANKMEVKREPTDIAKVTRAILADFEPIMAVKGIQGQFTSHEPSLIVDMDRHLYERILFNLLSNAVKFTDEKGSISVDLAHKGDRLELKVADTGIGISEEDQQHLFQKFRQLEGSADRRYEGTGLGLALVKNFSELLGGHVSVQSRPGEGSVFSVNLLAPAADAKALIRSDSQHAPMFHAALPRVEPMHRGEQAQVNGALPKVLIAEDNSELSTYISSAIQDICQTKTAVHGDEALAILKDWQPDLIISDVMMPERDGLSLCRAIKSNEGTLHIPVVLLTALTHREALIRGWEAGADEYLFKPFHPTELITRVKTLLEGAASRKESEGHRLALVRESAAREEAEKNVQRLEKIEVELRRINRLKDEFLAMISHELRTPMNAILGWCELLVEQQVDEAEYHEIFKILYRSAKAQARIIDDVLDMSNIITGKMQLHIEPVRLSAIIAETVDSMRLAAQTRKLSLEMALDHAAGLVGGDPDRLRQVVWNLLSNAIKFSRNGGVIQIVLEKQESKVVLTVADQGEGIDPEFQPHVFERFLQEDSSLTRKFGGLGLGLSIVKYIVESHGGSIEVQSPGKGFGTTFRVVLPVLAVGEVVEEKSKGNSIALVNSSEEKSSHQQVL
ncbi:ATP-binding response regulator [Oligoflexus tunisiensis]|uniref:ATP-binding response regulator n=1 Tax=Oligoflexus tunisiensis TaxID=708132 RepID=UPI00114C9EF1|nr:ATP-binding protein [Oligoflexus tunisiensis]